MVAALRMMDWARKAKESVQHVLRSISRTGRGTVNAYVSRAAVFNATVLVAGFLVSAALGATSAANKATIKVLALGDSITAGYGLPAKDSLPRRLEAALREKGLAIDVLNGGVSGDTTAGGLARLDWMLAEKPDLIIIELGGNDGLRGLDPKETYANLDRILTKLDHTKIKVLLTGMLAPPNLGAEYGREFNAIYPTLAHHHNCVLYPFILDGVATDPALNQADGIHPNAKGVDVIVERLTPYIMRMLKG